MRGRGLKAILIFLDLVFLAALIGAVYFVFIDKRFKSKREDILKNKTVVSVLHKNRQKTVNQGEIVRISKVLDPAPIAKAEPTTATGNEEEKKEETEIENLIVFGVIYSSISKYSSAIIFDKETNEQLNLFIGEEHKGWKLVKVIDRLTVLLAKDGVEKEVKKSEDVSAMLSASAPNGAPANANPSGNNVRPPTRPGVRPNPWKRSAVNKQPNTHTNTTTRPASQKRTISRAFLRQIASKFDQHYQEVYAKPFVVNGRSIGMQVSKLDRNSQLNAFGIQRGDIIKTWNGMPITSERQCLDLMNKYRKNVNSIPATNNVTVIRNGREIKMTIQLR